MKCNSCQIWLLRNMFRKSNYVSLAQISMFYCVRSSFEVFQFETFYYKFTTWKHDCSNELAFINELHLNKTQQQKLISIRPTFRYVTNTSAVHICPLVYPVSTALRAQKKRRRCSCRAIATWLKVKQSIKSICS